MIKPCFEIVLELDSLNNSFELITESDDDFTIFALEEDNSDIFLDLSSNDETFFLDILDSDELDFIIESGTAIVNYIEGEIYSGSYVVTPSSMPQTLSTENRVLLQDITINAIPSCYGLIEWSGSVMRIS